MSQGYGVSSITGDGEEILINLVELGKQLNDEDQEFVDELWDRMQRGSQTEFTISTVEYMRLRVIWEQSL